MINFNKQNLPFFKPKKNTNNRLKGLIALVLMVLGMQVSWGQVSFTGTGSGNTYTQTFDNSGTSTTYIGSLATLPTGWTSSSGTYGGFYSRGNVYVSSNGNFALRNLSGGTEIAIGAKPAAGTATNIIFSGTNNTGAAITGFTVTWNVEQYSAAATATTLDFTYNINGGSYVTTGISGTTLVTASTGAGANLGSITSTSRSITITSINVPSTQGFTFKFAIGGASGAQAHMGIDDFTVFASGVSSTNYYSKATGNLELTSSWTTDAAGGTGTAPTNFTTASQVFNIRNRIAATIGAAWTVSGTNSKIIVGDGTNGCNFTIPALYSVTGTVDVAAAATLTNTNTNTTIPTLGTLNATSTVVFNAAGAQTVPIATYGNLSVSNTGSTTATAAGAITVTNALTVSSGSTFDMSTFALSGSALTTSGTGTLKTQNVTAPPLPTGRTWTMDVLYNSASSQTVVAGTFANLNLTGGNRTLIASGTINISGIYTPGAGTLTVTSNTINFNGADGQTIPAATYNILTSTNNTRTFANGVIKIASTFTPGSSNYTIGTSTVEFNGSSAQTIPVLPVASGGNYYNLTYSGSSTGTLGGSVTVAGDFVQSAGTFQVTSSATSSAITMNLTGNATFSNAAIFNLLNSITNGAAATVTVTGNTTTSGTSSINLESVDNTNVSGKGIFQTTDFTTTSTNTTIVDFGATTVTGNEFRISGNFSKSGVGKFTTYSGSASTGFVFNKSGTQTFSYSGANSQYTQYLVNSGSTLQLSSSLTMGSATNPTSTFTVNGTLDMGTNIISGTTDPTFTLGATGAIITSNTGGLVTAITTPGTNVFTAGASYTFNGATTTPFHSATLGNPSNLIINANVTLNKSSTITNSISLTSGTLAVGANTLTLSGSTINRDGTTYIGNIDASNASATVAFTNTSALTIPANTFTGTCKNITMNGSGGITLSSDLTIVGTLTFTSGKITTGSNKVILTSAASVSRISGHVIGIMQKNVAASATTKTFEIGNASNYTPITLALTSVTGAGDLAASTTIPGAAPASASGIHPTKYLNRYWTLTNSGITLTSFDPTFTFVSGDIQGSAATSSFVGAKLTSSAWTNPTVGTLTSTSSQLTGVTSFGDFYLGEPGTPTVTSVAASSISTTGAVLNGTVNDNGSATTIGFDYGTTTSYGSSGTANPASILSGAGATSVTSTIGSLSVNTQYNFRANATNSLGTTNGSNLTFYTLANVPGTPTVNNPTNTTLDVLIDANSNPSGTEFAIQETGGNYVQANGSLGVSAVWQTAFVWGTKMVTGLSGGTLYTFQVKARNGDNTATSFGTSANGTTTSSVAPTITSPTATAILSTTATLGGNVTSDGGAAISARGVVWSATSLNPAPQLSGSNVTIVTGTGTTGVFTTSATSLPTATQISYSAYATNSQGTSYTTPTTFYTLGAEPTTQATAIVFSSQSASSLVVSWTNGNGGRRAVFMKAAAGSITNPSDANAYTASSDWNSKGTQLGTSGYYCIYDGTGSTVTVTNLAAATAYYVQVFDYNSDVTPTAATFNYYTATATGNPGNSITLSSNLSAHAASFTVAPASTTSLTLTFTAASTITNAAGYIILQKSGNSAPTGTPTNATSYSVGNTIGDGTVAAIITNTATTSTTISGLAYASSYSFTLIPFNWNTVNTGTYNYYTAATIPSATGTTSTPTAPIISTPTSASVTTTTATLGGNVTNDGGDPVTERGIVWSETSLNANPVIGGSNVTKVALGSGTTGVYTVATTGLTSGVSISYKAYATNSTGTSYTTVGSITTLATEPITISSSMTFPTYTTSSVQVSFTSGNGANRIVVARLSTTTRVAPTDANGYAVSSASFTDLSNVTTGTGNVVVYNGASNTVTVTNLSAGTTYAFDVYEYNGSSASANYLTSSYLTGSKTTIFAEPTVQASGVNFTNVSSTSFTINWTKGGDGVTPSTGSLIIVKDVSAVDAVPVDGTIYTAGGSFGAGTEIGTSSGNFVVYRATVSTVNITNLIDGHTYHVAVFASNGAAGSGSENYLTTSPARGSQMASIPTYYSQATGNPATLSNWNSIRTGGGSTPPDFTTTANFVIQNSHTMTTTAALWSFGGSGSKLQIERGGTLTSVFPITIFITATFQIDNGGTYIHNNTGAPSNSIFAGIESFGASSNFIIQNWAATSNTIPSAISFGNLSLTWSPSGSWNQSGSLTSILGDFTINNGSSNEFRLTGNTNFILTIGGDMIVTSGILNFASGTGAPTINIGGSFNQTGGTISSSGSSTLINFTGSDKTFTQSGGTLTNTNINWTIANGASLTLVNNLPVATSRTLTVGGGTSGILDCSSLAVSGAGTFTLSAGATLKTAHASGISGAITATTKTFSSAANYEFNGAATGTFTTAPTASTVNNLTINRSAGVALSQSIAVAGTLSQTSGNLAIGAYTLTLNGAISGSGTLTGGSSSNLTIGGTAGTIQFTSGSTNNYLKNLTLNASSSMTIGSNALNITGGSTFGVVTVGTGATLATGGFLTLRSDANGTASIGTSLGTVSGNVTVERYVSGAGRYWRFLSSPVQSATVANWMTQFYVTGPCTIAPTSGLGSINDLGWHTSQANIDYPGPYDASTNPRAVRYTSIRQYVEANATSSSASGLNAGWADVATNTTLTPGKGFRAFIRGPIGTTGQLNGTVPGQAAVTLSLSGTVNQGAVSAPTLTYSGSGLGWNLIGNPYPCAYDWTSNSTVKTNIVNTVHVFDATSNGYKSYNTSSGGSLTSGYIPSGAAFFVQATGNGAAVTFNEAAKITGSAPIGVHKGAKTNEFTIKYSKDSTENDEFIAMIIDNATLNNDSYDIIKLRNENLNLSSYGEDTMQLTLSAIPPVIGETRIKLNVEATQIATYNFDFKNMDNFDAGVSVSLFDRFTNTTTDVKKNTKYTFDMGPGVNQWGKNRFELILNLDKTNLDEFNLLNKTQMLVYPNPATDVLNISINNASFKNSTITITNVSGKEIMNTNMSGANAQINIEGLSNGIYFVNITNENGFNKTVKFVK